MRPRAHQVLRRKPTVETDGDVDRLHQFSRLGGETAAPHALPPRRVHVRALGRGGVVGIGGVSHMRISPAVPGKEQAKGRGKGLASLGAAGAFAMAAVLYVMVSGCSKSGTDLKALAV